jgi:hypothetical protein
MERTTVYLPLELKVSIKAVAKRKGSSEAEVIREALARYVDDPEQTRPWPKSIGIASSGEVPARELDEWLAENWKLD